MLIRDGAAQLHGDFGVRTVTAGDLVMLRAGLECGSVSLAPVDVVTAYLNPTFLVDQLRWTMPGLVQDRRAVFREMVRAVPDVRSVPLTDDQFGSLHEQFDLLARMTAADAAPGERVAGATELIWRVSEIVAPSLEDSGLMSPLSLGVTPARDEIHEVLRLMHEDFTARRSVAELARAVALSESAMRRAFQAETGMGPRRYLNQLRLARFEEFIVNTTMPITQATRLVGWSSTAHARRLFALDYGMSPREYRSVARRRSS